MATYNYLSNGGDGAIVNQTAEPLGFYGKTPIAQRASYAAVTHIEPAASTSTLVASIQSIAIYAASQANSIRASLVALGLLS